MGTHNENYAKWKKNHEFKCFSILILGLYYLLQENLTCSAGNWTWVTLIASHLDPAKQVIFSFKKPKLQFTMH